MSWITSFDNVMLDGQPLGSIWPFDGFLSIFSFDGKQQVINYFLKKFKKA